jgi:hypothetical protein
MSSNTALETPMQARPTSTADLFKKVDEQVRQPGIREALAVHARWQQIEAIYANQQQILGAVPVIVGSSTNFPASH